MAMCAFPSHAWDVLNAVNFALGGGGRAIALRYNRRLILFAWNRKNPEDSP
jgi:hypothetical protein